MNLKASQFDSKDINFDFISQYNARGENMRQHTEQLTNEELSFANFCYAVLNACYYIQGEDENGTRTNITSLPKNIRNSLFKMFLNTIEREVLSRVQEDEASRKLIFVKPNHDPLYYTELGCYYDQVADFILLTHGLKSYNSSIDERRNSSANSYDKALELCDQCKILDLAEEIDKKVQPQRN